MSKTYEQVVQELDAKIPRECISSREGAKGTKLSYLAGWYVIDRLNKVLGIGNWAYSSEANVVHSGVVKNYKGEESFAVHYLAKVRLVVELPGGVKTEFVDYGYGDGTDRSNAGKAHELAVKEAVTDGIKRCAKNLGMSLGLALYSKEGDNIEESAPAPKAVAQGPAPAAAKPATTPPPGNERDATNKAITAISKVVLAKKLKTLDELKAEMGAKYGTDAVSKLKDDQAKELLTTLKELANNGQ